MIARFFILLPFDLFITEATDWPALQLDSTDYHVRVNAPSLIAERPRPMDTILAPALWVQKLAPASFTQTVLVNGQNVAQVNVLVVDFIKAEFDRSHERLRTAPDPPPALAFEAANAALGRIRVVSRAFQIRPLVISRDLWQLFYLSDDGQLLEAEEGKGRGIGSIPVTIGWAALTPETIQMVAQPSDEPYVWDQLLLDAQSLLPNAGSAIVMAVAALETFMAWALNILHEVRPLPAGLWAWIKERDEDLRKQPSTSEEFDALLRAFTGRSLKDEPKLWQQFCELRSARNHLVHEGVATVGGKPVEADKARELVESAGKTIEWVELLLPEANRRARTAATGPFSRQIVTPDEARALGFADKQVQFRPLPTGFSFKLEPKTEGEPDSAVGGSLPAVEAKAPVAVSHKDTPESS
jgi:hypothetical protein